MRGNGERGRGPSMDRKQERRIEAAGRDEDLGWKGGGRGRARVVASLRILLNKLMIIQ